MPGQVVGQGQGGGCGTAGWVGAGGRVGAQVPSQVPLGRTG